jgi:FkbM family methyltransferase
MNDNSKDTVVFDPHDYDNQTIAVMQRSLKNNSNCIDVGCHAGSFLDVILRLAPNGAHMAFEPLPDLFSVLKDKYAKYPNVALYDYALSNVSGETNFQHVTTNKGFSGLKKRKYDRPNETIEEIKVKMAPLDTLVPKDSPIHFIKIDVEGAELQVLQGAIHTIRKYRPVIIFEHGLGAADHYGTKPEDVYDLLTAECGLNISLMLNWLNGGKNLNKEEFSYQFNNGKNYYFMAYR